MTRRHRVAFLWAMIGLGLGLLPGAAAETVVPDAGFVVSGSTADVRRGIDVAHDAGARWVSLVVDWEALEPEPDSYRSPGGPGTGNWDELGARLDYAASRDMNVEIRLLDAPGWASGRSGVSDDPPTPGNLPAYADFLKDLAGRFGSQIDAYSPWNEPNRPALWNPPDADAFTALQKTAYPAIKAVDPTATVLYGPVVGRYASINSGYTFLRRSYQLGLKGHADVIGWNGYPGGPPESSAPVEGGVPAGNTLPAQLYLRDLIDQYDPGRRVWIMELGWSTCSPCNVSAANGVSEAQQADYVTRAFTYRRRYLTGVTDKIFWYVVRDDGPDKSDWFQNHGLVRYDWSAKPALAAFRALGVEAPGAGSGGGAGSGVGGGTQPGLPTVATRIGLPTTLVTGRGRVTLGRVRVSARKGFFTLRFRAIVRGGASQVRLEGYRRALRWQLITRLTLRGSGTVQVRVRDKGYLGFRLRATVPGQKGKGYRVGRVVLIPKRLLNVP